MPESFPDPLRETRLATETVFRGRLLEVRRDTVRLPNAQTASREYIVHPGAVAILPLLDNGDLLFERQFRYPVGKSFLELPAGKIDPGETGAAAAVRELREETGYIAHDWQSLGPIHPCIGYSSEHIEIFVARQLTRVSAPTLDAEEFLELRPLSLATIHAAILNGDITDAKTLAALYLAQLHQLF
ncbi:MAG: NUDIX hydrolase [Zoogloeaceae bacterium]|jgi:ADP-ribose pyrophosphatase|nr:NUDIX hydrolase [Zoogloeaceae bacterium]